MAILFNVELNEHDYAFAYANLQYSPLSDTSWETELITYLYDDQKQIMDLIGLSESYAEEIYTYSSQNIWLRYGHITSSIDPSIESLYIEIQKDGNESCVGLMTGQAAVNVMDPFFWRAYSSVHLINMLYSPANETSEYDPMATFELSKSTFLGLSPGETLRNCTTDTLGAPVKSASIDSSRVIPFFDIRRTYFNQIDTISLGTYTLYNNDAVFTDNKITMNSAQFSGALVLTDAIGAGGFLSLVDYESAYLQKGGYVSDKSSVGKDIETNTATVEEVVKNFNENKSPIEGWESHDVVKNDTKSNEYMDEIIDDILNNTKQYDRNGINSLVTKKEAIYMLDKLIYEIVNTEVCDDS